jgi:hypothetical protein
MWQIVRPIGCVVLVVVAVVVCVEECVDVGVVVTDMLPVEETDEVFVMVAELFTLDVAVVDADVPLVVVNVETKLEVNVVNAVVVAEVDKLVEPVVVTVLVAVDKSVADAVVDCDADADVVLDVVAEVSPVVETEEEMEVVCVVRTQLVNRPTEYASIIVLIASAVRVQCGSLSSENNPVSEQEILAEKLSLKSLTTSDISSDVLAHSAASLRITKFWMTSQVKLTFRPVQPLKISASRFASASQPEIPPRETPR